MPNWIIRIFKPIRDMSNRLRPKWWLRKVRKANIPVTERDICERYGENTIAQTLASGHTPRSKDLQVIYHTDETVQHARDWLTERADYHERRERWISGRDFFLEIVIIALIGWEIHEGRQQAKVLQHMDTSAAATSASLQRLVAAQDASLKIIQQEQAERAKKPRLALYAGNIPVDKASVRLKPHPGSAQAAASLDLLLKNEGEAPVSTFRVHALVPVGVVLQTDQLITVPESEPPAHPST